ncbi:MAG: hypothetical protein QOD72_866 [Acidimicrobiaceae bacterium]|nr:hypothetical protein [Acidimicrobiaceae bacterium]
MRGEGAADLVDIAVRRRGLTAGDEAIPLLVRLPAPPRSVSRPGLVLVRSMMTSSVHARRPALEWSVSFSE